MKQIKDEMELTGKPIEGGRAMPPLFLRLSPEKRRYYKFRFTEDGYPAQRRPDGSLYEHPLYPIYVIDEYLAQFAKFKSQEALAAACTVADAALRRALPHHDALVLWYTPEARVRRMATKHYSALTQAYYVKRLSRLARLTGEARYKSAACAFVASLMIGADQGGVARFNANGAGLEELPYETPELILNGWLSAVATLIEERYALEDESVHAFVDRNLDLIEHLLPQYDCPELLNSRYSLAGPCTIRLKYPSDVDFSIRDVTFQYSKAEICKIAARSRSPWTNGFLKSHFNAETGEVRGSGELLLNLVLSRAGAENRLCFFGRAKRSTEVQIEARNGEYDPLSTSPVRARWTTVASIRAETETLEYSIALKGSVLDLIGYPTNFTKSFGGRNRNVYHPIHINRLDDLYRYQSRGRFREYCEKWIGYLRQWPHEPLYRDLIMLDYAKTLRANLRPLLEPQQPVNVQWTGSRSDKYSVVSKRSINPGLQIRRLRNSTRNVLRHWAWNLLRRRR